MGDQLPRLTGGGKPSHPRLTGGGGGTQVRRLVANEQFVTPKNFSQPKPKPAPKKSHGFLGGIVQGVEHATHKVEHVAADAYHQQAGPSKPGLLSNAKGPGIGKQLSVVSGLPSGVFTHPIGFIHHQQHLSPQDKANSAIGTHVLGALFGAPVAGRVSGAAARRGEAVAFSGGGKDAEKEATHPLLRPAVSTEQMAKDVRDRLAGATKLRREQDVLYSQERGKRAAAGAEVMQQVGGVSGHRAALNELKGELPKLKFGGFENFDQSGLDALMNHIQGHLTLQFYDKINAQAAILKVLDGKVPTPSDLKLLHKVFGEDVAKNIHESLPFWQRAKNAGLETLNIPRSLMSSMDLSAPFRQGLVVGVTHPRMFFKNFAPMVKAFGSENVYRSIMEDIVTRPNFPKYNDAHLALTDLGSLETREEQFMSNYAERIPVVGRAVRASDRAYVGFLNKTRADLFDYLLESAHQQGRDIENDRHLLDSIGKYVNSATGRGDLGAFQKHAVTLNTLLFSPRLLFSRLNFMNPVYYAKLDPFARKEALKSARNLVGTMGLVLYTAKLAGAHVNDDPRNADFAKIRIGNTRIDLAGGFQQPVRLLAQLFSGKIVSSTTGRTLTLGPQGPGKLSRRDIIQRFVEGKLGPVPSVVNDFFKGTDFQGKPFTWKKEAYTHMLPLLAQDAADLEKQSGPAAAAGGYALGSFGFGIQSYGPKKNPADKKTGDPILDRLLNSNQGSPGISPEVQKKIDDLLNKP